MDGNPSFLRHDFAGGEIAFSSVLNVLKKEDHYAKGGWVFGTRPTSASEVFDSAMDGGGNHPGHFCL
jgi:hypothetical protein